MSPFSILLRIVLCVPLVSFGLSVQANDQKKWPEISEPSWMNTTFLSNQRGVVDELSRRHFGVQIHGDKSDLLTLQRLLDKQVIERDDKNTLQALGVVLGDVYISENKNLQWRVYEDELDRSHAICIKNTQHCLFPITMLSRRIEAGLNPNVEEVYQKGLKSIEDYLPKLPFSD